MLDHDLAKLYGVEVRMLNQTIARNLERFPPDSCSNSAMRRMVIDHKDLSQRLDALEARYDGRFNVVFKAIRRLMAPRRRPGKAIGFRPESDE